MTWAAVRTVVLAVTCLAVGLIIGAVIVYVHYAMPLAVAGHVIHTAGLAGMAAGWAIGLGWAHCEACRR